MTFDPCSTDWKQNLKKRPSTPPHWVRLDRMRVCICHLLISFASPASAFVWLNVALFRTRNGSVRTAASSSHKLRQRCSPTGTPWVTSRKETLVLCSKRPQEGRAPASPPLQREETLYLCSPATGCVSAGALSTAPGRTEGRGTPLHRTWETTRRKDDKRENTSFN